MDITITMTKEQSGNVRELIINHMEFLEDEYYINPDDPLGDQRGGIIRDLQDVERNHAVDEYIGLKMVSEEIKASWKKPA